MILAIFDLQVAMILPAKLANYSFQEKKCKTDFQDLGLQSGTILAIFDLYAALILPTMFQVNWPLGSGEEALNRFSRWPPWLPFWIFDWNDFSYFFIYKLLPIFPTHWPFSLGEKA